MFVLVSSFLLLIKSSCQYRLCLFRSEMISQNLQKHKGQSSSCRTEQGILLFCHVSCVYALLYSIGDAQSQATQYSVHSSCRRWFLNYELKKKINGCRRRCYFQPISIKFCPYSFVRKHKQYQLGSMTLPHLTKLKEYQRHMTNI